MAVAPPLSKCNTQPPGYASFQNAVGPVGAIPPAVRDGVAGSAFVEFSGPSMYEQNTPNMLQAREDANNVPGRYDNLPQLTSRYGYRDTDTELKPHQWGDYQYDKMHQGDTMLERQFNNILTPNETPLSYGVLPWVGRGTGTQLPDPISGEDLKPQKRENLDTDMFVATGDSLPSRFDFNPIVTGEAQRRAHESSKFNSGSGALNYYSHINDEPGSSTNALFGFATGQVMSSREGGYHPRERFFRVPETKRGRNQHEIRAGNPSTATWHPNSIYQKSTAPLGELRLNRNADVRDYYRPPERTGGIAKQHIRAQSEYVDMGFVNRDPGCSGFMTGRSGGVDDPGIRKKLRAAANAKNGAMGGRQETPRYDPDDLDWAACDRSDPIRSGTQRSWAGPPVNTQGGQELRREIDPYIAPKNLQDFQLRAFSTAAHGSQVGTYVYSDFSSDLCDNITQRTVLDDVTSRAPAPTASSRGNASVYGTTDFTRGGGYDSTVMGRAHQGGRNENMTADASSGQRFNEYHLRQTSKDEPGFVERAAVHAPVSDRQLAVQYDPNFPCPVTRRVQPQVENFIDFGGVQPYLDNPYTQPLPNPGVTSG